MKAIVQRVTHASVTVDGKVVGAIEQGLLILVGVTHTDTHKEADWLARKIATLRVFRSLDGPSHFDRTRSTSAGRRWSSHNSHSMAMHAKAAGPISHALRAPRLPPR